jgi:hypothetical protein
MLFRRLQTIPSRLSRMAGTYDIDAFTARLRNPGYIVVKWDQGHEEEQVLRITADAKLYFSGKTGLFGKIFHSADDFWPISDIKTEICDAELGQPRAFLIIKSPSKSPNAAGGAPKPVTWRACWRLTLRSLPGCEERDINYIMSGLKILAERLQADSTYHTQLKSPVHPVPKFKLKEFTAHLRDPGYLVIKWHHGVPERKTLRVNQYGELYFSAKGTLLRKAMYTSEDFWPLESIASIEVCAPEKDKPRAFLVIKDDPTEA